MILKNIVQRIFIVIFPSICSIDVQLIYSSSRIGTTKRIYNFFFQLLSVATRKIKYFYDPRYIEKNKFTFYK